MSEIIYLIGKSGTGKYTIAQQLKKHGYIICDNQLVNYAIFSLLDYDGSASFTVPDAAWLAISKIRDSIFSFLSTEHEFSYVLTNVLGDIIEDHRLFKQVEQMALKRKSVFIPVKLTLSIEENIRRITNLNRKQRFKTIDPEDVYLQHSLINIIHPNLLEIDVTDLTAKRVAQIILNKVSNILKVS